VVTGIFDYTGTNHFAKDETHMLVEHSRNIHDHLTMRQKDPE